MSDAKGCGQGSVSPRLHLRMSLPALGMVLALLSVFASPVLASQASTTRPHKAVRRHEVNPLATGSLRSFLATRTGNITVALYNLDTKTTYLYRPGVEEQTASIVKVDILATLLHELQVSKRSLDEDDQDEASYMIEDSDNDAANDLWDEVGRAPAITSFDHLAGMDATTPDAEGYWGETMTTALDQVELVKHLVLVNTVLDSSSRAYELNLMRHVVSVDYWGITVGPTVGASVAVKNGWVPIVAGDWQVNSIGFVAGAGRSYVIAVLTSGNPSEYNGIETIDGISARVWSALAPAPVR